MKKQIKQNYKQKKRAIKTAFKEELRALKADYFQNMEQYQQQTQPNLVNPPKRSVLEEVGNAVTHGVGALFAIVAYILMLLASDRDIELVGASIYFFGLFVMFLMSCLYHAFRHGSTVKRVFRRFDYLSIYLLIGATFAPILLCFVGGIFGSIFLVVQWLIIATGITLVSVFGPNRYKALHMTLYITLGWSGLILFPMMIKTALPFLLYILGGGVIYSLGIIPFAAKKKASHFVWHFFVLGGAIVQWLGIYLYLYL